MKENLKFSDKKKKTVALSGNPNVGKSTLFNALTGMKQHTGNWPGKTVNVAFGTLETKEHELNLVDIPGTYSLDIRSHEEEIARDFLFFDKPDATVVVCDATSLERNLSFVFSICEICDNVIVCVNLLDEAKRKGVSVDLDLLQKELGVKVVGTVARKKKTLKKLTDTLNECVKTHNKANFVYEDTLESALKEIETSVEAITNSTSGSRFIAISLLCGESDFLNSFKIKTGKDLPADENIKKSLEKAKQILAEKGKDTSDIKNYIAEQKAKKAQIVHNECVTYKNDRYSPKDKKLDKIFTGKYTAFPIMFLLLCLVFWITLKGANYPSALLSRLSLKAENLLLNFFNYINMPAVVSSFLLEGVFRVLCWVVSVMLPPMAIFFPLFTLLEDFGYLPRIAYNLDKPFCKCNACGKQALCMCMGFGCNAAGVTGCRIIDSKRERLLAVLTNSFVPCNGKFPTLITLISLFFVSASFIPDSVSTTFFLSLMIVFGVVLTFLFTKILSVTLLKGEPSAFTLELPPYRKPQVGSVIVRSLFDRTIFVLLRAVAVAAPAGAVIWLLGNININGESIIAVLSSFLNPFGKALGLDGVIILAFILGFPANEIILPLILMMYSSNAVISDNYSLTAVKDILLSNGWTSLTAVCTAVFSLLHWPCSTTLLTVKKETGSFKWTFISALLPTLAGIILCFLIKSLSLLF